MFRPTGLTLRAAHSKERGHLFDARPPLLCQVFAKEGNIPLFKVAHYPKFDYFVNILAA